RRRLAAATVVLVEPALLSEIGVRIARLLGERRAGQRGGQTRRGKHARALPNPNRSRTRTRMTLAHELAPARTRASDRVICEPHSVQRTTEPGSLQVSNWRMKVICVFGRVDRLTRHFGEIAPQHRASTSSKLRSS